MKKSVKTAKIILVLAVIAMLACMFTLGLVHETHCQSDSCSVCAGVEKSRYAYLFAFCCAVLTAVILCLKILFNFKFITFTFSLVSLKTKLTS
ncbi:MAG: hypothetical protein MR909_02580 [Clostridiales bacterium]|nr:hypothetical protein [Clostridiales bacterium]